VTPIQSLSGSWNYCPDLEGQGEKEGFHLPGFDDTTWQDMPIPGHWHLAGLDFLGKVWFRKRFVPEQAEGSRLCFKGVDYMARVWFNGNYLGSHTGYFDPFYFDVSDNMEPGRENIVAVEVDGSPDPGFPFRKKFFKGGLGHWDMRPGGWSERGQDMTTAGIWAPVYLESSGPAYLAELVASVRKETDKDQWLVELDMSVINRRDMPLESELYISLSPKNFSAGTDYSFTERRTLAPGMNALHLEYLIDSPETWWTWDMGEPCLYLLSVKLVIEGNVSNQASRQVGFREVSWRDDGIYLNDKRVFIRGSCYLSSLWLGEMTHERTLSDLDLVKGAGMNSLRICYHVEPLHFYDLCDQAGILLWQDFPMLWDYSTSGDSIAEAERQIRRMVRLLTHHPCIYMWVCHCEPMAPSNRMMDKRLAGAVAEEDRTGRRIKPSTFMQEHPFYGWYFGTRLGFVGIPGRPLPNEYGTQSLPRARARLWQDLGDAAWPPNPAWEYHNYQPELFFSMRDCSSLDEMIERSQAYQGEVLDFGIQSFRRAKGKVWGTYIFTFVDAWPSITWSIVDYERNTKASYQRVKKAYKRVKLSMDILQDDKIPSPWLGWLAWNNHFDMGEEFKANIWIINDLPKELQHARLTLELFGPKGILSSGENVLVIRPDSSEKAVHISVPLSKEIPSGRYMLRARLHHEDKEVDQEGLDLFFGPKGTRSRNAFRQLRAWARADLYHAIFAVRTFPVHLAKALLGRYKRQYLNNNP
jgi:beta-mannosidase